MALLLRSGLFLAGLCILCLTFAHAAPSASQPSAFPAIGRGLPDNAHRVTAKLICGAQPDDDAAFKALRDLGIKTIISVDGTKPDVAAARKYGMRYVHLPIGYDGVHPDQGKAIAKAIEELPGPIYLHCHHGKHRSAAAAAVGCVYNGMLRPDQAETVLKTFGTGENYKGLWRDARSARPVDPAELDALKVHYVETAEISDLADAMVDVDKHWDFVKAIRQAGWKTPGDHPDLDPPQEALLLAEHFTEIGRMDETAKRPDAFRKILGDARGGSESLRAAVSDPASVDPAAAEESFRRVAGSCAACHKSFRD